MNRPEISKILLIGKWGDAMRQTLAEAAPGADIVMAETDEDRDREIVDATVAIGGKLTDEQLRSAEKLVWHHVPWVGVENIASPVHEEKGILLTNGSGVNSANISEHVIAMMLAFARQLPRFVRDQDEHAWRHWEDGPSFFELSDSRVLLLGTGNIGQAVARRLSGFNCTIIGASRSGKEQPGFDACVSLADLEAELPLADHVISSLPMTPATAQIMNRERLMAMKLGAYFYNVGRGGTVDQEALIELLETGHIAGAGLDVVEPEPLPEEHPLWTTPNVLITSHTSGNSPQANTRMATLSAEQLRRYQNGEDLLNVVDMEAGY